MGHRNLEILKRSYFQRGQNKAQAFPKYSNFFKLFIFYNLKNISILSQFSYKFDSIELHSCFQIPMSHVWCLMSNVRGPMSSWSWRSWQFLVYWSLTLKQLHLVFLLDLDFETYILSFSITWFQLSLEFQSNQKECNLLFLYCNMQTCINN